MLIFQKISVYAMPLILLAFALVLLLGKGKLAESFAKGAGDGAASCFNLLPTMLLVMCGVSALFSSGAVDVLTEILSPVLTFFGVPEEMLPSIVLRPFSGSGVTAVADRMFAEAGADSESSKIASILMGSTDTIIYTLSVYFSAAKIKTTRYALPASFLVFFFSIFVSVFLGKLFL